ncbi:MAG TPA: acetate--CoA ligase [Actinomycetota bacterium]|jgi:acetyl-CoA synthetase|nr:acetate--CoA ligase [Actinomycetota bacterium]
MPDIENLLEELRTFDPPEEFRRQAVVSSDEIYAEADTDFEGFWAEQAAEHVTWFRKWDTVLEWNAPFAKWFVGGKLNIAYNCLDRHVEAGFGDKVAYHWEGEPGDTKTVTYKWLLDETCRVANALKELGVQTGDRVAIYLPMVPELPAVMLACARIGAPHTVVFAGFSADSLSGRINDAGAKVLVTADGGWRRGQIVPLKENSDEALKDTPTISKALVLKRTENDVSMTQGRDVWYHDIVPKQSTECPAEELDAEHPLYLLYTSGTTAKPKGILHTTGGYLVGTSTTHHFIFDLKRNEDVYWCAADVGWVTGHSYIVYGPLCNGATSILYEGAPDWPDKDRLWAIAERYKATILYTAPTAIRAFMKWGTQYPEAHDLSSLRLLGTVGEPINPEAWVWYHTYIGGGRCPIVDTWWQTETGMIMITPLPGITTLKPGSATHPFPGVGADVVNDQGESQPLGGAGYIVLTRPWPAMLRTIWGDDERYKETYWSKFPGMYFPGDGCKRDEEGYFWFLGRVDDVMNVAGHRISTYEVESALVDHETVAESAVVGRVGEDKAENIVAFVTLKASVEGDESLLTELREHVARKIGKIARPAMIIFTDDLPKTRSGKIMRRLLRDVAEGRPLGDVTTLANETVVEEIRDKAAARAGADED